MLEEKSRPKAGETSWLWLLKLLTGLGIVILLGIHFVVNHFLAKEGLLTHADVVAYYKNPWIIAMEALFLTIVVTHSLIGTRSIILDLKPSEGLLRAIDVTLVLIGVVSVIYGVWLLQAVVALA